MPPGYPHDGALHAVERIPSRFDIGSFAVVNILNISYFFNQLQAVVGIVKGTQGLLYLRDANAGHAGGEHGRQHILAIVLTR